jgi:environmental stress-induced protein Ves
MRLIGPADYRRMPWKNGGGATIEIAVSPSRASLDTFDWRVSMATVIESGPFSSFPGIDRTLCVLRGNGIRLDVDGNATTLTQSSAPFAFAADARVSGTPLDGPITDLNVMTRRGRFGHAVSQKTAVRSLALQAVGSTSLIFSRNACRIASHTEMIDVPAGASILIENEAGGRYELAATGAIELIQVALFAV